MSLSKAVADIDIMKKVNEAKEAKKMLEKRKKQDK
jgi:hypothetical protein